MPPKILPVSTIQPTFPEVVAEVRDGFASSSSFWLSIYKSDAPSVHATIHAELDERQRDIVRLATSDNRLKLSSNGSNGYRVTCTELNVVDTEIIVPVQEYRHPERSDPQHPYRITAFAVSPSQSEFATGFLDGTISISPASPISVPPPTSPDVLTTVPSLGGVVHKSTVTTLQFFPRSPAILSAGADYTLHVLGTEGSTVTPEPTQTLRGHTRPITSVNILEHGRSALSSSLDASIKVWDISSATATSSTTASSAISATALDGTDTIVRCALHSGAVQAFDLRSSSSIGTIPASHPGVPLQAIASADHLLATGSAKGLVTIHDVRRPDAPLVSFRRTEASVEDLSFVRGGNLVIATEDGLPYIAGLDDAGSARVRMELVGVDCDAVRALHVCPGEVWYAGDDAVVRRYQL